MEQIDRSDWKKILIGETLLYGLLGKALYTELERSWLETLISEDVFAEPPFGEEEPEVLRGLELLQKWVRENSQGVADETLKALKEDHFQLFIGVDQVLAPPWESVHRSERRLVFQEQTLQVREWYSRFGLQAERIHREPDDHIGLELTFMAHLSALALQAICQEDMQTLAGILQAQRDFLAEHLLCWAPGWANLVITHAQTDYYRGLAHLALGTLLATQTFLESVKNEEVVA